MEGEIKNYLSEHIQVIESLGDHDHIAILVKIARAICLSVSKGGKVVLFGNGGSAADAQHIAAELIGRFRRERNAMAALALNTNTSVISAIANDYSFDQIFARQVEALVNERDVVVGISTSGESRNVFEGLTAAKRKGACTIAFTGGNGGMLREIVDIYLAIPSYITSYIQEAHITAGHIICFLIEENKFTNDNDNTDMLNITKAHSEIKVIALDIDGVLTDGTFMINKSEIENKSLFFRDIDAISLGMKEGLQFALITGEDNMMVDRIARRLGINIVMKKSKDKVGAIGQLSTQLTIPTQQICYVGDSDKDASALEMVGWGVAPSNASNNAKKSADYVCQNPGGAGAVSEIIEKVLKWNAKT